MTASAADRARLEDELRAHGLRDEPGPVGIDLDDDEEEPAHATRDRLGVRVTAGRRQLVVWPGVGDVRLSAFVDGSPAVVTGEATTRRVGDRLTLAHHLADAERGGARGSGAQRAWLRLLELALATIDERRDPGWAVGLPPPSDDPVADYVSFPLIRAGLDSMLLAHRSRGKTTLMLAVELSLLAGVEIVPGLPPLSPVDAVVHVNYENGTDLIHASMRSIVGGWGGASQGVLDRWAVIGQGGTPRLDRLAEHVADVVAEAFPDATSVLLDVDSAEAAIATLGTDGNGDNWGGRASALFNAYADTRRLLPGVTVSTLTSDHGDAKNPGLVDEVDTFQRMGAYGSRRKADLARAVHTLGVFGSTLHESDGMVVRELMIGTAKPWPDRQAAEPVAVIACHDTDTGDVVFGAGQRRAKTYPDGISAGSRGAKLVDAMRKGREEERTWWTTSDLVAALVAGGDTGAYLDDRIRETLRRHRRVFVGGPAGWRLSGSVR